MKCDLVHDFQDLIVIFRECFFERYNTLLVKGEDEPLYLPANENQPHSCLIFAHGFFASALHECSHWLIAGENRRKLVDFGYWYNPDGRTADEQQLFEKFEIKPQALEWILSKAAGFSFRISNDNLNGSESDTRVFKEAILDQVKIYCQQGLSERAETFRRALCGFYGRSLSLDGADFSLESLG
jgi:elongation factor P hydroxylase